MDRADEQTPGLNEQVRGGRPGAEEQKLAEEDTKNKP